MSELREVFGDKKIISGKFFYDDQDGQVHDNNGPVLNVRMYGRLSSKYGDEEARRLQDVFGEWAAKVLNKERGY